MKKIISIGVIITVALVLLVSFFIDINRINYVTTVNNYYTYNVDKGSLFLKNEDATVSVDGLDAFKLTAPLFSYENNLVSFPSSGNVIYVDENAEVVAYQYGPELYINKIDDDIYQIVDSESTSALPNQKNYYMNFSKEELGDADIFLQVSPTSVFFAYESELFIDSSTEPIYIPEMSYVSVQHNKLIITYMNEGNLVIEDYYFDDNFKLNYGSLQFTKSSVSSTVAEVEYDIAALASNVKKVEELDTLVSDDVLIDEGTVNRKGEPTSNNSIFGEPQSPSDDPNIDTPSQSGDSNNPAGDPVAGTGSGNSSGSGSDNSGSGGDNSLGDANGGGYNDEEVITYTPPKVTSASIISKEINPYESIQLSITIDNPDAYTIVNIVTSEGTFMVNSDVNGELIIELPPKEAGVYEIYLESMTVTKSKVESIPIDKTLTYTVLDTPYITTGNYNDKEKYEETADATITFEASSTIASDFMLNEITIDEKVYSNIEKTNSNTFVVYDVDVARYNEAGKYNSEIQNYTITYNGNQYDSAQISNNTIDGNNYKELYDQNNFDITASISGNTLVYSLKVDDPDKSILNIVATLYTESGELVQTVKVNGSSTGSYKISFKDLAGGINYYAEFNVTYSKTDASMAQTKLHSDQEHLYIIPFVLPTITSVTYPEIVIEDTNYDLTVEISNPDNFVLDNMVINGVTYDSNDIYAVGDSGYKIENIQLIGNDLEPYLYNFTIETITWINPLGDEMVIDYNEPYAVGRTFMPTVYSDAAGYLYVDFEMFASPTQYALEYIVTIDGVDYLATSMLESGSNVFKSKIPVSESTIATVKFTVYSETGYSLKITEDDNDYLIMNTIESYAISDTNSFSLDSSGNIQVNGADVDGSTDVPSGSFDKILFQNGTGIALDLSTYSASAWGLNSDLIQTEFDKYAGEIVDVNMANVSSSENTLISVTLKSGEYKLIGQDIDGRISQSPSTKNAGIVIPAESGVIVIDRKGNIVPGGSSDSEQSIILNSVPYEYMSGTTKVTDVTFGKNGIAIHESSGEAFYMSVGSDQPIYMPGASTIYNTFGFYQGIEGSSSGAISLVYYVEEDGTFGVAVNENVGMPAYIAEIPGYITDTEASIVEIDATNNYIGFKYSDDTYNFIGRDDNSQMMINTIQVEPEITTVTGTSYDGNELLPTEKFILSVGLNNNTNGAYLTSVTIQDESGVEKTFTNGKEHEFSDAEVDNITLASVIGSNNYSVTAATYTNRFNPNDYIDVEYNPGIPFSIECVPGIKVNQSYGEDLEVIYGVNDTSKTITLSYASTDSSEWIDITPLPNDSNNELVPYNEEAKSVKFRIQVRSGASVYESYETEPMIIFDHTNNASSTTSTFTYLDPKTSEIIIKGDSTNPIVTTAKPVPESGNSFIKIETVNKLGFVMDDAGNLYVFGDSTLSSEFNNLIAPYQGSIIDFQVIGLNGGKDAVPIVNIVLNNGTNELLIPAEAAPAWNVTTLEEVDPFYVTGDSDIVYYLQKDGTFGYIGSDSPYGTHTFEPFIPAIEDGTIKVQQIEFTEQATYLFTTSNQLFVNRRDMYSSSNVCFYEQNGQTIGSIDSASFDSLTIPYGYDDLYMQNVSIEVNGVLTNCSTSGAQAPVIDSQTYKLPTYIFTYDADTSYTTLIDGVMYQNSTDYYYAGTNIKTRMTINYYIGGADIVTTPGDDHAVFEITYSHPSDVDSYKIYNHATNSYFDASQVHVANDNIVTLDGLTPDTEYTISIDAMTTSPSGENEASRINYEPITFVTNSDAQYEPPEVLSYEIIPTNSEKTEFDITLIYYYPDSSNEFVVTPSISSGTIVFEKKETSGPVTKLEYSAYTTDPNAEISWTSQETLDYSKPFSYYADSPEDFYNTIMNPNNYENQFITGTYVPIYKSPKDGKYYPMADQSGPHQLLSAEMGSPNNYYMDTEGNINPNYVRSGGGYEGFCASGYSNPNADSKNGIIMSLDQECVNGTTTHNTHEQLGFKTNANQFVRWDSQDKIYVQITGWEEIGTSGNYGFTYQFIEYNTNNIIDVNQEMTIKYDSTKPVHQQVSFWKNTPADGINIYNTEYYLVPLDGQEAYFNPLVIPNVNIGAGDANDVYPYANRSGIQIDVGVDTSVMQYNIYINEGKNNTDLSSATHVYSTTQDNVITGFADTEYNKDYTFIVTAETKTESDVYINSVNTNEWENAMRHQTYYSNLYGAITYILLDDGSILCSNLEVQAIIDDMQAQGVKFSSVNGMIVTQDGEKYNPFTMALAPEEYVRYMEQSFVKKNDGTYVFDASQGTDANDWYSTSTDLVRLLNENYANNGTEITLIATSHTDSSATFYDFNNKPENINYLGTPVEHVTNSTAVMDTSNGAPDYGGGLYYTYTLVEGQPIKEGMDSGEGGARYFITPDDKLVTTWKNTTSIPAWLPVSNIHSICQGGSQFGQIVSIQTKDGTIYNWNFMTGVPTRLNGINIHTGEVNTMKSSIHANISQNKMNRETRQFYREVSKGTANIALEANPYKVIETYETEYAYMQSIPGRMSVDEVISENGLDPVLYAENKEYNHMVDSLVEDMAISQPEAEKIVNDYVYATSGAVPVTPDGTYENDVENSIAYLESNNYISEEEANNALNSEVETIEGDTSIDTTSNTISQVDNKENIDNATIILLTLSIVITSSIFVFRKK